MIQNKLFQQIIKHSVFHLFAPFIKSVAHTFVVEAEFSFEDICLETSFMLEFGAGEKALEWSCWSNLYWYKDKTQIY